MTRQRQQTATVRIDRCTDRAAWNDLVERAGGPIYSRWEWGRACVHYGHDQHYLGAYADGRLVGGLPLVRVRSLFFGDTLVSMPYCSRGSVALDPDADDPAAAERGLLDRARDLADDLGVDLLALRGPKLSDHPDYEHRRRWVTFEVPLDGGPDAVWDALDSDRRNHVRNARDNGLDFRIGDSVDDLRTFYDLYLESMRGHGSPPHSFGFLRRLWDAFHDDGELVVALVELDGRAINASIELPHDDRVFGWSGVGDYEYRDLDGGSLLQWKVLEWAAERGYDRYDIGRTREGSGVYMFKKTFGGEKTWYDNYYYAPDGEVEPPRLEDDRYDRAKDVWRRLPIPVTRLVGPHIRKGISL